MRPADLFQRAREMHALGRPERSIRAALYRLNDKYCDPDLHPVEIEIMVCSLQPHPSVCYLVGDLYGPLMRYRFRH